MSMVNTDDFSVSDIGGAEKKRSYFQHESNLWPSGRLFQGPVGRTIRANTGLCFKIKPRFFLFFSDNFSVSSF